MCDWSSDVCSSDLRTLGYRERLDQAVSDDLNPPLALPVLDEMLADKKLSPAERLAALTDFDAVLGLDLATITREALRVRPKAATITPEAIADRLAERPGARAAKDFDRSDPLRDALQAIGSESCRERGGTSV